jgi:hypothetical protein
MINSSVFIRSPSSTDIWRISQISPKHRYVDDIPILQFCRYNTDTCNLSHFFGCCQIGVPRNKVLAKLKGQIIVPDSPLLGCDYKLISKIDLGEISAES